MATRTRKPARTIIAAAIAAAVLAPVLDAAQLRGADIESGEPRDLVNRPDCWTDAENGFDRCIFR